jgi:hypothetical protein
VVLAVSAPVPCDPLADFLPDQAPDAVQAVAFCVDQSSVAAPPVLTVLGRVLKAMTGAGLETVTVVDWVAEPPEPVQVSSNSVEFASAPVR